MASFLYATAKKKLLDADIDLLADTIKAVMLESAYAPVAGDEFLNQVAAGNRQGTPQTLANKSTAAGVFDADDISFPAVPADAACNKVLIYKDTGAEGTSPLIAVLDMNLAVTPNGGDIDVAFSSGAERIFRLN